MRYFLATALRVYHLFSGWIWMHGFSMPLRSGCRFSPTCSEYFADMIEQRGVFTGAVLGAKRLMSCHGLTSGPGKIKTS